MAQRDRSQGFGFVYVNVAKVISGQESDASEVRSINFNRDPKVKVANDSPSAQQIRENLDRLQSLHHKLHAMLEELNTLTDKKKR